MATFPKPRILLGVSGSVAAYKSLDLARRLSAFSEVRVVLTPAAARMVDPAAFRAVLGRPAATDLFEGVTPVKPGTPSGSHPLVHVPHIEFARGCDLVLLAPATANLLAKLALGLADDLLTTSCLYASCPLWAAPAMNVRMWNHPATVQNTRLLLSRGVRMLGPESGHLACGEEGAGRFTEPSEIAGEVRDFLAKGRSWRGLGVLVTAGPTEEALDPVRFLTNRSSGKMGYALAQAALNRGAAVTLVTGPTALLPPAGAKVVQVRTALEMRAEVTKALPKTGLLLMAAAVADYRPRAESPGKIKKGEGGLLLGLEKNPDILAEALKLRKKGQLIVGFAAETGDLEKNAMEKLRKKPCDLLAANRVGRGRVFGEDESELVLFSGKLGKPLALPRDSKAALAGKLLDVLEKHWKLSAKGKK